MSMHHCPSDIVDFVLNIINRFKRKLCKDYNFCTIYWR